MGVYVGSRQFDSACTGNIILDLACCNGIDVGLERSRLHAGTQSTVKSKNSVPYNDVTNRRSRRARQRASRPWLICFSITRRTAGLYSGQEVNGIVDDDDDAAWLSAARDRRPVHPADRDKR